jgi:hypothetical protein
VTTTMYVVIIVVVKVSVSVVLDDPRKKLFISLHT